MASSWWKIGSDIDGEAASDSSGWSVSLSADGTVLAIGAKSNDGNGTGANTGHTRIYQYSSGSWSQLGEDINGEAAGDLSGMSVSLSADGSVVAIGSYGNDENGEDSGHTRIYQYSSGTWSQLGADIDGKAAREAAGVSISLSSDGTVVAIGTEGQILNENGQRSGLTRIYQYSSGSWSQLGADIVGEPKWGYAGLQVVSLSSDGTIVAIGAYRSDGNGENSGRARIYQYSSGSWSQLGADIVGDAAEDNLGIAVSLSADGSVVAIGARSNGSYSSADGSGHVRIYQNINNTWTKIGDDIDGEAAWDKSGGSVGSISLSADGSVVAIGANGNDGNGTSSGHVRIYQNVNNTWTKIGEDIDGEAEQDISGYSVSLSADGTIVAIGAPYNDGAGIESGHVRIYQASDTPPTPTINAVTSTTADGSYTVGDAISISVAFSRTVTVDTTNGIPTLQLNTGSTKRDAIYTSGSGSSTLVFAYNVHAGDTASDLDYTTTTALSLNNGTIKDSAGNNATLILPIVGGSSSLAGSSAFVIDTTPPTISAVTSTTADGSYTVGDAISISVAFSESVDVVTTNGTPTLELETGSQKRTATYTSGSGSSTLVFSYTVKANDTASDLDYTSTSALSLNNGTIKDAAGNNATLILPTVGGSSSLAGSSALVIDGGRYFYTQIGSDIDGEAASDSSGWSVSLSADGTVLAIGAKSNDGNGTGANTGHTRIYQYSSGSWSQLGEDINGEAAGDLSGMSVSLSADGSVVAIGSYGNDENGEDSGHTRIYQYSSGTWSQLGADIDGKAAREAAGVSISLSSDGTVVAIGTEGQILNENGQRSGLTRIYQYSSGSWSQLGADIVGEPKWGYAGLQVVSLSSDGTIVAIGAYRSDGNGENSGRARIYQYSSGSWSQLGADIVGDAAEDNLGIAVSLSADGSVVAIGARSNGSYSSADGSGHVRIYQNINNTWTKIGDDIDGEAAWDKSGGSVGSISLSADGSVVAIGANGNDGNGTSSGHVRIYQNVNNTWTKIGEDIDGEAEQDISGYSVSLSADGTIVAIGAPYNDGAGIESGHVRIYQASDTPPTPTINAVTSTTADGSYTVGDAISISVAFSRTVTVDTTNGIPTLQLNTGSTKRDAIYTSGSGSSTLVFAYNVHAGDTASDLDYTTTTALSLNNGTIKDSAGNNATLILPSPGTANSLGANNQLIIDTTPPGAPSFSSTSATTTSDTTPTITGSAEAGTRVNLYRNLIILPGHNDPKQDIDYVVAQLLTKILIGSDTADNNDVFSITSSTLSDSTYSLTATATDNAGNTSTASSTLSITIDTKAPSAPSSLTTSATTTSDTTPTITGRAEAGSTVKLYSGTTILGSHAADNNGAFSITSSTLSDSTYSLTATATDNAGNTSTESSPLSVTIDGTVPSITGPSGPAGATTSNKSLTENNTAVHTFTANETVSWSLGGGVDQALFNIDSSTGALTFKDAPNIINPSDLDNNNTYIVNVRATDLAGNTSYQTVTVSISLTEFETNGSVTLAKNSVGAGYIKTTGSNTYIPIQDSNGAHLGDRTYAGWSLISAETISGVNQTAWKHTSGKVWIHQHDANWALVGGGQAGISGNSVFHALETGFNHDLDDDGHIGSPPISVTDFETNGSVTLAKNSVGAGYIKTAGSNTYVAIEDGSGNLIGDQTYRGWSLISAETISGVNQTAWKHTSGKVWIHRHDGNWALVGGGQAGISGNSVFHALETGFNHDLDDDGHIGTPPISVTDFETNGSVTLAKNSDGAGYIKTAGSNTYVAIEDGSGNLIGDQTYRGWSLISAETINGINQTAWKHTSGKVWIHQHDANWALVGGGQAGISGNSVFHAFETGFNHDLDDDGHIGTPPISVTDFETNGSVTLAKNSVGAGYIKTTGSNTYVAIEDGSGNLIGDQTYRGWSLISAETISGVNQTAWKHTSGKVWIHQHDANWALVGGGQAGISGNSVFHALETGFNHDLDDDGHIGSPPISVTDFETNGSVTLAKNSVGAGYIKTAGSNTYVAIEDGSGNLIGDQTYRGWSLISAETISGVNQTAWKHTSGKVWIHRHDANWALVGGGQAGISGNSVFHAFETGFNHDLDDDGHIGTPPISITDFETNGSVTLAKNSDGAGYIKTAGSNTYVAIEDGSGNLIGDQTYRGWSLISAETISGVNQTAWKHTSGKVWIHRHDANWALVGGGQAGISGNSVFHALETGFNHDLDDDGHIGSPPISATDIETNGSVTLAKNSDGAGYIKTTGSNTYVAIEDGSGNLIGDQTYRGWSLISAETISGVNQTAWKHTSGKVWIHRHDANWAIVGGGQAGISGTPAFHALETGFNHDLDNDGHIGTPLISVAGYIGNPYTPTTIKASVLNTFNYSSSDPFDASSVMTITGTLEEVKAAYISTGITGLGNETIILNDLSNGVSQSDVTEIGSLTTGDRYIQYPEDQLLTGDNSNDHLIGNVRDETLLGLDGNDILLGYGGNDQLIGGNGNDTLQGGMGDDLLIGGLGDDILYGNSGFDIFQVSGAGQDTIKDFTKGEDKIDVSALETYTLGSLGKHAVLYQNNNLITIIEDSGGKLDLSTTLDYLI
ncbi:Ig-like domain-containing protein [Prochlorococcus marinus]|uniref:Ig-like domain-containing protein n=1 Tax=Prochlorococcus marinus TaxID=1219 RepID=UPI0039B652A4